MVGTAVALSGQVVGIVPAHCRVVAVGARNLSAAAAEGVLGHIVAENPLLAGPIVIVQILNHSPPSDLTGVAVLQGFRVEISVPQASHTVRSAAHKSQVVAAISGTGLGKHIHANAGHDVHSRTNAYIGIPGDRQVQQLVHNGGVLLGHHPFSRVVPVVQDHVALVVLHIGVGIGLIVQAAVGKHCKPCGHFLHGHAVGLAAQSHGGQAVGVIFRKAGKVQFLSQPLVAGLRGQLPGKPSRRCVLRNHNGVVHIQVAQILPGHVLGTFLGGTLPKVIGNRAVVEHRAVGDGAGLQPQGVHTQRLDGRAGLPAGLGGAVFQQHALPLIAAAHNGDHTSRIGIHDEKACLDIFIFRHAIPREEHLLQIILNLRIHGGVNLQAGVVDHIHRNIVGIPIGGLQVLHNLVEHGVDIPVPGIEVLLLFHTFGFLHFPAAEGHGVQLGQGLVVLLFRDGGNLALQVRGDHQLIVAFVSIGQVPHPVQHRTCPVFSLFREHQGVVLGGVLGDAGNQSALGQGTLCNALSEVGLGCRLYPFVLSAVVHHVEIGLQNLLLGVLLLHIQSGKDLSNLTQNTHLVFLGDVLDKLLGQGGTAPAASGKQLDHSARRIPPVHAFMLAEPVVLNGNLRCLHIGRDVAQRDPLSVGVPVNGHVFRGVSRLIVHIDKAGVTQRHGGQIRGLHIPKAQQERSHGKKHKQPGYTQNTQHCFDRFPNHAAHCLGRGAGRLRKLPLRPLRRRRGIAGSILIHISFV